MPPEGVALPAAQIASGARLVAALLLTGRPVGAVQVASRRRFLGRAKVFLHFQAAGLVLGQGEADSAFAPERSFRVVADPSAASVSYGTLVDVDAICSVFRIQGESGPAGAVKRSGRIGAQLIAAAVIDGAFVFICFFN